MKNLFVFALTLHLAAISFGSGCFAEGSSVRGGGDQCENRIKIIRDDLRDWMDQGGHKGLVLPPGLTMTQYFGNMLREISLVLKG